MVDNVAVVSVHDKCLPDESVHWPKLMTTLAQIQNLVWTCSPHNLCEALGATSDDED